MIHTLTLDDVLVAETVTVAEVTAAIGRRLADIPLAVLITGAAGLTGRPFAVPEPEEAPCGNDADYF